MGRSKKAVIAVLVTLIVTVLMCIAAIAVKPCKIMSRSMSPAIDKNDVVMIVKCSIEDIEIGDIVMCEVTSDINIVHRVVTVSKNEGNIELKTKGDGNSEVDVWKVNVDNYRGKCVASLNNGGINLW